VGEKFIGHNNAYESITHPQKKGKKLMLFLKRYFSWLFYYKWLLLALEVFNPRLPYHHNNDKSKGEELWVTFLSTSSTVKTT
jgi:hypothetical protein